MWRRSPSEPEILTTENAREKKKNTSPNKHVFSRQRIMRESTRARLFFVHSKNNHQYAYVSFQCSIECWFKVSWENNGSRVVINNDIAEFWRRAECAREEGEGRGVCCRHSVSTIFARLFREIDVSRAERAQYNNFVILVTLDVSNLHFERECMSYLFGTREREREKRRGDRAGSKKARGPERLNFTVRGSET